MLFGLNNTYTSLHYCIHRIFQRFLYIAIIVLLNNNLLFSIIYFVVKNMFKKYAKLVLSLGNNVNHGNSELTS